MSTQESSAETKDDLQRLRKSLVQVEEMIQLKNNKIMTYIKSLKKAIESLQMVFGESKEILATSCQSALMYYYSFSICNIP